MHHMSGPMGCLERIDNLNSERNALHAEVERLTNQVESERALRAIVEEERDMLRARLDEAEGLLRRCYRGGSGEVDAAIVAFCQPHVISPPDGPYSAHTIQVENARAHARESDLWPAIRALEEKVAALEETNESVLRKRAFYYMAGAAGPLPSSAMATATPVAKPQAAETGHAYKECCSDTCGTDHCVHVELDGTACGQPSTHPIHAKKETP